MKKKLLSLALALVMCLGLASPALADWENATDVHDYEEFAAALEDGKVEEIRIAGEVDIPESAGKIETDKPIIVSTEGRLTFEPGAEMYSTSGMGKFWFEDFQNTWTMVSEMCEAFLLWNQEDGGIYRNIYGTQPADMLAAAIDNPDYLSTAVFSGGDVVLEDVDWEYTIDTLMVFGHNFIAGKDVTLKVYSMFTVDGDLYLNEGAGMTLENGGSVSGDVYCADPAQVPENLEVGGEIKELPEPEPAPIAFTDVAEDSPFKDAIAWAVAEKITNGTSATTFGPSNTCTHNHILTFLWRANGSPAAEGSSDFEKAIAWAKAQGLAETVDGGAACTRAQTMMYLWKLAGSPETAVNSAFTDVAADADYAQAVAWAVEQGVTKGTSATTFGPDNTCTRGQIVTFLYRNLK